MRIPRLHIKQPLQAATQIRLDQDESRYLLRVLRLRNGADVRLFDGHGSEFAGRITACERNAATVDLGEEIQALPESPLQIMLAPAMPKGERMDYLLQKSVELGVSSIHPLTLTRNDVNLRGDRVARRIKHWEGVIRSACEQCGRAIVPAISAPTKLGNWLESSAALSAMRLVLHGNGSFGLQALRPPQNNTVIMITGPEGGLTDEELSLCEQAMYSRVTIGPRTLRAETAGPAAIAAVQTLWGDLG